jgi:hypothetical protein
MRNNDERLGANVSNQDSVPPQLFNQMTQTSGNSVGQLTFVAPTEFVYLPSKGKYYPEGHPLFNKETIEIRQMTAKEEDILANKSYIKKGVAIDRLLESLLVDKTIDLDSLLLGDKNALIIASRISGYGAEYGVGVQCPDCGEKFENQFNLYELQSKQEDEERELPEGVEKTERNTFKTVLPITKWEVEFRALTGKDEKDIARMIENRKKMNPNAEASVLDQIRTILVSIQGVSDRSAIAQAVNNLPARDSRYLRSLFQVCVPNVKFTQDITCTSCGVTNKLEVPLTVEFFWPK